MFFSCGTIIGNVIEAANIIEQEHNISVKIVNMHTIKPIDREEIIKNKNFKLHVCVEEHNVIGGLASAISEVKCEESIFVKQINLGVNDQYSKSGSYEFMLDYYNLSAKRIANKVIKEIK